MEGYGLILIYFPDKVFALVFPVAIDCFQASVAVFKIFKYFNTNLCNTSSLDECPVLDLAS